MSAGMLSDTEGTDLVAAILTRKRLTEELKAADDEHTRVMQAAAGGHGDWFAVRQAAEVVRQARAALRAVGGDDE